MIGSLKAPISTSTSKMRRPLASIKARAVAPVRSTTMRSQTFLGRPENSRPLAEAHERAGAAELEVQEVDAPLFAVSADQADAALHVPGGEGGFADVDDVDHHDRVLGVGQLELRRENAPRRGRVGLPVDVEALLVVHLTGIEEGVELFSRCEVAAVSHGVHSPSRR